MSDVVVGVLLEVAEVVDVAGGGLGEPALDGGEEVGVVPEVELPGRDASEGGQDDVAVVLYPHAVALVDGRLGEGVREQGGRVAGAVGAGVHAGGA